MTRSVNLYLRYEGHSWGVQVRARCRKAEGAPSVCVRVLHGGCRSPPRRTSRKTRRKMRRWRSQGRLREMGRSQNRPACGPARAAAIWFVGLTAFDFTAYVDLAGFAASSYNPPEKTRTRGTENPYTMSWERKNVGKLLRWTRLRIESRRPKKVPDTFRARNGPQAALAVQPPGCDNGRNVAEFQQARVARNQRGIRWPKGGRHTSYRS